jgi:hypothetical protein
MRTSEVFDSIDSYDSKVYSGGQGPGVNQRDTHDFQVVRKQHLPCLWNDSKRHSMHSIPGPFMVPPSRSSKADTLKGLGDTETPKFENLFEQSDVKTAYYR